MMLSVGQRYKGWYDNRWSNPTIDPETIGCGEVTSFQVFKTVFNTTDGTWIPSSDLYVNNDTLSYALDASYTEFVKSP